MQSQPGTSAPLWAKTLSLPSISHLFTAFYRIFPDSIMYMHAGKSDPCQPLVFPYFSARRGKLSTRSIPGHVCSYSSRLNGGGGGREETKKKREGTGHTTGATASCRRKRARGGGRRYKKKQTVCIPPSGRHVTVCKRAVPMLMYCTVLRTNDK